MDEHLAVVRDLMAARISFAVHYVGQPPQHSWVITIAQALDNEQLKAVVYLGGSMEPNKEMLLTGRFTTE